MFDNDDSIYEDIMKLQDEINVAYMTSPSVRPDFGPTQIRDWHEIRVGMKVRLHNRLGSEVGTVVVSDWMTKKFYIQHETWKDFVSGHYFTDNNLIPYEGRGLNGEDVWNPSNWMERIS